MRGGSLAPHAHLTEHRTHKHGAQSHAPRRADLGAVFRSRIEYARVQREGAASDDERGDREDDFGDLFE